MFTDILAGPSLSLGVYQCNKTWCVEFLRAKLFLHHYVLFQLAQLFIHGNSQYLFPKRWNWHICHVHRAFKVPLHTVSCELQTFPTVKSKTNWISSRSNLTVHFSSLQKYSVWVTYGKQAAEYGLFKSSWHMLPYMMHMTLDMRALKIARRLVLSRTTSSVTDVHIASRLSRMR